jgi:hypothetical protein
LLPPQRLSDGAAYGGRLRKALLGVAVALWLAPSAHAATRILYLGDWTGHPEVFAVDPSGKAPVAQLTHWHGACPELPLSYGSLAQLMPSPNGRHLLAACASKLWLMDANGSGLRQIATDIVGRVSWGPKSNEFIYALSRSTHIVNAATGRDRLATAADIARVGWTPTGLPSPNRRLTATLDKGALTITTSKGDSGVASFGGVVAAAWSPDGKRLAIENRHLIRVFDLSTRRLRPVAGGLGFGETPPPQYAIDAPPGLTWAPDSRRIAYVTGEQILYGAAWRIASGNLMTATLSGRTSAVVKRDSAYGGRVTAVAWTTVPRQTRYAAAEPEPSERVAPDGLLANGTIERLAADGARVAFIACDRIVIWTPATRAVDIRGVAQEPGVCSYQDLTGRHRFYDLALAGNRVAYALSDGCNTIDITLYLQQLDGAPAEQRLERSGGNCGGPFAAALGRLAGSGDLLVYGRWHEAFPAMPPGTFNYTVTEATVHRVDGDACPCPTIASTFGPLYLADANAGRVVAYGTNATLVFDRDGAQVVSIPVSPQAAQLAGNDLVLVTDGELRDYDIRGAAPLHTWKLPDMTSGPVCGWRYCDQPRLVLTDAARGLVAYVLDGQLHLLRLADGADRSLGYASDARFMDAGLVYADGARLRLVPFDQLPLRAF